MTQSAEGARPPGGYNKPGFWALIVTQFQGAFSDNVYKAMILLYMGTLLQKGEGAEQAASTTWLATALFNLPWLLFPAIAGALADRFSKKQITVWTKVWEVGVMAVGAMALLYGSPTLLFAMLFLMAMQSTFFSPAKYGIMPELLPETKLSWGNGVLNLWTFVAIILGTVAAGLMLTGPMGLAATLLVGFSLIGLCSSVFVTNVPPAEPTRRIPVNPYSGMGKYLKMFYADAWLFLTMVGIAYFWFAGALVIQAVTELGLAEIPGDTRMQGLLLAIMALGIGCGSMAAGWVSRGKIETGLVPLGLAGMAAMCFLLVVPGLGLPLTFAVLFGLGFFAGWYDIPLAAMLQQRSPDKMKGGMIATSNFVTFSAMTVSALLFYLLFNKLGLSPRGVLAVTGLITACMLVYVSARQPIMLLRVLLWLLDGTRCKLEVSGRAHLPEKGGALLVANHLSFADVLILIAAVDRHLCFVVGSGAKAVPWMRRVGGMVDVIWVDKNMDARHADRVADEVRRKIALGHVVCVNTAPRMHPEDPELPWYRDYARLLAGLNAPLIPLHLERQWEGLYSQVNGRLVLRKPFRWRQPVRIRMGAPLPMETSAGALRRRVMELGMELAMTRRHRHQILQHGFIREARRNLKRFAIADGISGELNYLKTLVGSIVFARKLNAVLDSQEKVGVLLPPSVGGVLTNIALQLMGRVPVNLNYTASPEAMSSCAQQCNITQVLTSQKFLERLPLQVPGETILLENIRESVTGKDRIVAMLIALLAPVWLIDRILKAPRRTETDIATIIFSSGSEGDPKGVVLTHRNVMANIESVLQVFPRDERTRVIGYLPLFHSFGYTGTLWMPMLAGLGAIYHANPLEPKVIGGLIEKYKGTLMFGTSTFFQGFIRRCTSEQMASLQFVVAGAEKLAPRVREAFKEKFNVEPLEGYGTTECAPVVSCNLPDCDSPGFYVQCTSHGTIGRPLPGQFTRIIDPETGRELGVGEAGLLLVKGPNIMRGYLHLPEKTAKVLKDGWYETGDIAALDEEGFITITDRLARFSKIAGEMVPHTKVEEELHTLIGATEQVLAVSAVPDAQKGERLVVLHTLPDDQLETLLNGLSKSQLPNLWRPRPNAFYNIEAIPVLGTGKVDIKSVKKMAAALDLGE